MLTKKDLDLIEERMDRMMEEKFDTKLKPIHKKLNKLDNKIDIILRSLDSDNVGLMKRTSRIEDHLHLSAAF